MFALVQPWDDAVLHALVGIRTPPMSVLMEGVSIFGEWYVLLPMAAILVFAFSKKGWRVEATELAYTVIGTTIAVLVIKELVARPRPPEALRLAEEIGYSFPSWHASIAVAFWGYLAYLAMRRIEHETIRVIVAAASAALALTIGFSRLYLGVHYLSDVVGGFIVGGIALALSIHFTRRLRS